MEKGYETFVTELRKLLLVAMDLEEDEIYFAKKGKNMDVQGTGFLWNADILRKQKRYVVCIQKNFMNDIVRSIT